MAQVLIVGAGVTGSVLAMLVREMGLTVRVLEKSLGAGGRMSTHTFRESPGTRDAPVVGHADLGAQYITTRSSEDHPQLGPIYRRLTDAGVLRAFDGEVAGPNPYGASSSEARPSSSGGAGIVRHFTAPQGLRAVSQHFLEVGQTAGQTLSFGAALEEVSLAPGGTVVLRLAGAEGPLEALAEKAVIVFTQPVPQVLGASKHSLKGNFLQSTDQSVLAGLRKVQYSSRFAMAFSFSSSDFKWPYAWDVSYFEGGHVRYVSHDTAKRGAVEPSASIVVHSGVPLGMELVDEEEPFPDAAGRLTKELVDKLPEVLWKTATSTKVHKWRYSQVYKGYDGARPAPDWLWDPASAQAAAEVASGSLPLFRSGSSMILLAGDAVAPSSNFEGCVYSAYRTAAAIREFLAEGRAEL